MPGASGLHTRDCRLILGGKLIIPGLVVCVKKCCPEWVTFSVQPLDGSYPWFDPDLENNATTLTFRKSRD